MISSRVQRRKKWTAREAQRHIEAHDQSGLSAAEYERNNGIGDGRLWWWRRKLAQQDTASAANEFVPVHVAHENSASHPAERGCIELRLTGGRIITVKRGFDADTLREVLAVLETAPC